MGAQLLKVLIILGSIAMNSFKQGLLNPKEFVKSFSLDENSQQEMYNTISSWFHVIVGGTNDVAHSTMLDAINEIKKTNLYRQRVKKACKDALSRYEVFDKANMADMRSEEHDRRQLYMDFLDSVNERLKPHIFILRQSIKRVLDRNKIADSELKSHILTAYEMINYSVELFDKFFNAWLPCPPINLVKTFEKARLHPVRQAWQIVEDTICDDCRGIDLNKDKDCRLAFDIIETKLISEQSLQASSEEALILNPKEKLVADKAILQYDRQEHNKMVLSEAQVAYLKENYLTKTNRELADTIGCGLTKLREFAKELGLTKKKIA